jgi:two-component sensor histidine kinase
MRKHSFLPALPRPLPVLLLCLLAQAGFPDLRPGVVDLTQWKGGAAVDLSGMWLLSWDADAAGLPRDIHVPGNWTGTTASSRGSGTYHLDIALPDFSPEALPGGLAIAVPPVNSACELLWNGELLWRSGRVSADLSQVVEDVHPGLVSLPLRPGINHLDLRVANLHDPIAGILAAPRLGSLQTLVGERERSRMLDGFLAGSLLIMGLYHLGLYLFRTKDRSSIWFSLLCFLLALRQFDYGGYILLDNLPWIHWELQMRIAYGSRAGGILLVGLFLEGLMRPSVPRWFLPWLYIGAGGYTLSALLLPASLFVHGSFILLAYFAATGLIGLWIVLRSLSAGISGAGFFLSGYLALLVTSVHDSVKTLLSLPTPYLVSVGFLGFILFQSLSLIRSFTASLASSEANAARLERMNTEKQGLLRELYHRSNNNMQVVAALMDFRAMKVAGSSFPKVVQDIQNRISSMAVVQRMLYQLGDLSRIHLDDFVGTVAGIVARNHKREDCPLTVTVDSERMPVLIDSAIPCGLILAELMSNAYAHAFPGSCEGEIQVRLRKSEEGLISLRVADRGVGVAEGFDPEKTGGLGLQTVLGLARDQLHGEIEFTTIGGFACEVRFRDDSNRPRLRA